MRLICLLLAFAPLLASGQTLGDYRSFQSGPWNASTSWARFDGSIWVNPAPAPPSSATAGVVTIRISHTITVTAAQDTDETVVQTGGTLTINSGNPLTIADGNLVDLSNSGTINSSAEADLVFSNGSSYAHARNGGTIPPATWNNGSTCSVTGVTNTVPGGLGPSGGFFHFVWNSPQLVTIDLGGNLVDVNGDFTLQSANGAILRMSSSTSPVIDIDGDLIISGALSRFAFTTTGNPTIDVGGDFIFTSTHAAGSILSSSGSFNLTVHGDLDVNAPGGTLSFTNGGSNSIFNLEGDFLLTAGTITETVGSGTFNFTGTGTQTFTNTGTISAIIHYTIAASSDLDVVGESLLTGTGTLTVNGGLRLGSLNTLGALVIGSASGNVRTSGRVYNAGAVITYAGAGPQFIGNGHPTGASIETEIDNSAGVTFNTTTAPNSGGTSMLIAGDLRLTNGNLNIESSGGVTRQLTLNGNIIDNGNAITFAGATTNLSIGGTGALGTFPLPAGTSTIMNFTFNRTAGSVDFADSLSATGVTTVQNGTIDFNAGASVAGLVLSAGTTVFFEGQSLSISSNFTTAGGVLSSDFTSTLTLTGSAAFTSPLAFSPSGNNLQALVLNKSNAGNSVTVNSTLNVGNALTLTDGQLNIVGSTLVLTAGADLTRNSNASIATSSPGGGTWDLIYEGDSQTTGLEIPATGNLASLSVNANNAAVITLSQAITLSGALTITSSGRTLTSAANNVTVGSFSNAGTFNAPTAAASTGFTLNGNFANDGTFNNNTGTVVVSGSVAMSGSTINATAFNNILISGTGTLVAPGTLDVQGNFTNNGAFTAGSGTVLFDGAVGTKVLSGTTNSQFNNLTVNKLNAGLSLSVASTQTVNGTLTLTAGQLAIVASQLVLANGSTVSKNSSSSVVTSSPGGGPWHLVYVSGTQNTSLEIPTSGSLLSLTVSVDDTRSVTLTQAVTVSGAFSIPLAGRTFTSGANNVTVGSMSISGLFNAPTSAATTGLTLNGNFVNTGTFANAAGTVVINAGVAFSGSSMDGTLFNHITISGTGTLTPTATLNVQGNFTNNGAFVAGSGTVNFSGATGGRVLSGTTNTSFNNLVLNKSNVGTSLTVSSPQTVAGTMTLTQGQLAITSSNLLMGSGATLIRNSAASITSTSPGGGPYHLSYIGSSMSTGLEIPATSLASLTVNSNNAAVITLTTAASVTGAFTNGLAGRTFACGANNLTVGTFSNTGTFTAPSAAAATGLTLNGNFVNDGTFSNNSGTVVVNGASTLSGTVIDAVLFNTITITGTGALTPSTTLNVQGNFTNNGAFVAGSGTVNFSGATGSRVLSGTTNTSFNNVVLNKSNVGTSVTVSSTQTVAGTLTLTQGQLAITTSNLQMGNGATLVRNSTASITSSSPGGGPYNLSYTGASVSTGLEIPATSLASLTVNSNNAAVITLTTAATMTGAFTNGLAGRSFTCGNNNLTVGTFSNAGTFTAPSASATTGLTLNGNFVNDGTFTNNNGTIRVAGTVAMSGTAITTTDFRTIIITGSLTPSTPLNVQGSFTNNGTFVAGTGTVNFSGTTGGMTLSGTTNTSLYNVILAKSNAGVSVTVSSAQTVTNTLTLTQGQLSISSSSLQLSSGATLIRNPAGSIVTTSPGGGPYNLVYSGGSLTTGLEIPSGNLQSLTVSSNSAAVITLGSNVSMVGALTISAQAVGPTFTSGNRAISAASVSNGGVFDAPTPAALTLTGNLTNDGTFNRGAGTVIFAGTSTIAGTNNPTLHHTTISGTLTSPTSLLLTGNFTNNGTFNANGGTVSFNGTTAQSIAGSSTTLFRNINANNTAGVAVSGTGNLGGVLTLGAGVQFDADGASGTGVFTVLSLGDNPTADGSIATIPGTSSVTGAVTVQRYMRAKGTFNRYISPPVSNATATDLSDDFDSNGMRYYDESVPGTASLGYVDIGDAGALTPGRGYLAFMWDGAANITWDLRGPMTANQNQGAVNLNVTHTLSSPADPNSDGWNLVGNPYPSGIHWDNGAGWSKTDIAPIISVPDPSAGSGVFRTWNAATQTGSLPGGIVTMGQAFWVYVDLPGGSLIVNESAKTSSAGTFYRERNPDPVSTLTLSLTHKDVTDDSFITIQPNATDDYDKGLDGPKFPSVFSIATTGKSGRHMVFNAVAGVSDTWSMPLCVSGEEGTYSIKFSQDGSFARFEDLYLVDSFKGQSEKISGMSSYVFEISSDERSTRNRFYLTSNPGLVPLQDEGNVTISVYPNPVVDEVNVEITGKLVGETVLLNEVGGLVSRIEMIREGDRYRGTLSVGQHSAGMYFIKSVVDGRLMAIKLIKN